MTTLVWHKHTAGPRYGLGEFVCTSWLDDLTDAGAMVNLNHIRRLIDIVVSMGARRLCGRVVRWKGLSLKTTPNLLAARLAI